ncbi:hypothetical protein D0A34_12210 [Microcoleus vaginatus PCC 9802]|uniref:hypothetical protein n=1 Tax=Microcoleus vaginatus TaxID=119532 RepID=UPI00020D1F2E|nr:hypothetical protein MicvaDRAFT_4507 [Microcoleus vaginatus FGP-2]UNU19529.1 hypothetical protein D0A34_12210 [Microcoleus vaginatus PCC 9802]
MHKLLYFATIGLLAFSIGGCGGDEASNTASPSPSPSAASPSPAASASPTPATQPFQSPIVAAQPPGLIRSTNPEERARQAQTNIGDKKDRNPTLPLQPVPQGPVTANPSQLDPFGPLPPIALQIPAGANGAGGITSELPKLPQREVAVLPELPELLAPPPLNRPNQTVTIPRPPTGGRGGTQQVRGRSQGPLLPGGEGGQIGSPPQVPGLTAPRLGGGGRNGSLPGGTGVQIGSPPQVPGLTPPQLGRTRTSPPGLEPIAARPIGVPDLPELPVDKRPPQWRDPNARARRNTGTRPPATGPIAVRPQGAPNPQPRQPRRAGPPRPPQPIAARPIGVPDLPELPVDKRPPQWVDPNPPPPPVIPVVPPPPPPPSTDIATGTEVSGVVKVGNETQVIVKVPNEPTSRYVKVGQRLSNGQVLVKRVDLKQGADPIVILEENGVEVAKGVGEKPASRQSQPANAVISRLPNPNSSARR